MGLDMYAYKVKADVIGDAQVDINLAIELQKYLEIQGVFGIGADLETSMETRNKVYEEAKERNLVNLEFDYWRKFNALHGWMHDLYEKKGGEDPNFNCNTVRLTLEDLDSLESEAKDLKAIDGFFFGGLDDLTIVDFADIQAFVDRSREAIKDGYAIIYDSWW